MKIREVLAFDLCHAIKLTVKPAAEGVSGGGLKSVVLFEVASVITRDQLAILGAQACFFRTNGTVLDGWEKTRLKGGIEETTVKILSPRSNGAQLEMAPQKIERLTVFRMSDTEVALRFRIEFKGMGITLAQLLEEGGTFSTQITPLQRPLFDPQPASDHTKKKPAKVVVQ